MNDIERLDWLESMCNKGFCPNIINNDNGWWIVSFDGIQNMDFGDPPIEEFHTTCIVNEEETSLWRHTIREAIDARKEHENKREDPTSQSARA